VTIYSRSVYVCACDCVYTYDTVWVCTYTCIIISCILCVRACMCVSEWSLCLEYNIAIACTKNYL
jgi:hypothetical protein